MKPRAGQNQIRSPCPRALRAPARPHVRLSDTPRTGRAAEDVGPYHRSAPTRGVRTGPDTALRAMYPRRLGAGRRTEFLYRPESSVARNGRDALVASARSRPALGCRTPRARGGPPRTSAPTTVRPRRGASERAPTRGVRTAPTRGVRTAPARGVRTAPARPGVRP